MKVQKFKILQGMMPTIKVKFCSLHFNAVFGLILRQNAFMCSFILTFERISYIMRLKEGGADHEHGIRSNIVTSR